MRGPSVFVKTETGSFVPAPDAGLNCGASLANGATAMLVTSVVTGASALAYWFFFARNKDNVESRSPRGGAGAVSAAEAGVDMDAVFSTR